MSHFIPGSIIKTSKTKKGNEVVYRYPKWDDYEEMTSFINELSKEDTFIGFSGEQNTVKDEAKYVSSLFHLQEFQDAVVVHAYVNGVLAGRCDIVRILAMKERQKHIGRLGLTIAKNYRGEGVGEELLRITIDEAQKKMSGLKMVCLEVFGSNNIARALYKKVGFTEFGRLPKGILYKGEYIDEITMFYEL